MSWDVRLFQRPENGVWYVELERGRKRSLKTTDKRKARALYNQIRRQWLAGKLAHLAGQCVKSLGEYRDEFREWAEANQRPATCRANLLALQKLCHVAGENAKLDQITLRHLDHLVTDHLKKGLKPRSINNYIRHARAALNKAVEWGYIPANPLAKAREIPVERPPLAYLETHGEIARFLATIEDLDLRRLAVAYLATGRRRSELFALRWEDVDLDKGRYFVRRSKNHLSRWYYVNSLFRSVLESLLPGRGRVFDRWQHPDTISKVVKNALRQAGLGRLTLHSLRHTFASQQLMAGRSLDTIKELLGHTERRTTEIYAHLADDYLAEASEINLGPVDLGLGKKN